MRILIATALRPATADKARTVFQMIRESASEGSLVIPSFYWTDGPGCTNLAFELIGDPKEAEAFANALTMSLMPAKWSTTADSIPSWDSVDLKGAEMGECKHETA